MDTTGQRRTSQPQYVILIAAGDDIPRDHLHKFHAELPKSHAGDPVVPGDSQAETMLYRPQRTPGAEPAHILPTTPLYIFSFQISELKVNRETITAAVHTL